MRLEHQELRVFAAVAEQNGFKRAADVLCITQSAVSQAVANLERKLELPLFSRRPLTLTEGGIRLLRHARSVLREEEVVLGDLEEIRQGEAVARLNIGEMPSREIISAVLTGRVELGIGPFESRMPAFVTEELFRETRALVVSRNHPEAEQILGNPAEALKREPLLASYIDDAAQRPGSGRIRDRFRRVWLVRSVTLRLELIAY
jgi:DNA-binding transcriptional LysR family regulator